MPLALTGASPWRRALDVESTRVKIDGYLRQNVDLPAAPLPPYGLRLGSSRAPW